MKILILGAGQVGRTAAQSLAGEPANEVTVVDTNEQVLRDLQDRIDIRAVAGNASYPSVLESAGIADTDILIALTNSDEVNIVACQIAQLLYRTPTRIARIRAAEYTSRPQLFAEGGLAVDVWISPEELVTDYITHLLSNPGALQVVDFADGRVQLASVRARADGLLVGKPLRIAARAPARDRRSRRGDLPRRPPAADRRRHRDRRERRDLLRRRARRPQERCWPSCGGANRRCASS